MNVQSQELRPGNYIQNKYSKEVIKVLEVRTSVVLIKVDGLKIIKTYTVPLKAYEPIPLTASILLQNGFSEYNIGDNDYSTYMIGDEDLFLEIDWRRKDNGFNPQVMANELVTIGCAIKFVHQLQNIFHSLFQIELKIQL